MCFEIKFFFFFSEKDKNYFPYKTILKTIIPNFKNICASRMFCLIGIKFYTFEENNAKSKCLYNKCRMIIKVIFRSMSSFPYLIK